MLARSGSTVALAGMSGEYAGDIAADPWAMAQLSGWLGLILGR
ncbi:hypothetical protein [Tessaracoccus coleopterorum]|nr:hypothetical protein [Tessaracoccus coleopterorum]